MQGRRRTTVIFTLSLLAVLAVSGIVFNNNRAPALSTAVLNSLIAEAARALEDRDTDALLKDFTSDATVLDMPLDKMRPVLIQTMREIGNSHLSFTTANIELHPSGNSGTAALDLVVGEHIPKADMTYFHSRIYITLSKTEELKFGGLLHSQVWKIKSVSAQTATDIPVGSSD